MITLLHQSGPGGATLLLSTLIEGSTGERFDGCAGTERTCLTSDTNSDNPGIAGFLTAWINPCCRHYLQKQIRAG
ncbi:MAG: hypothetical protein QF387_01235, partial [Arenicellales bacterium]|nr:hypothetical protein [Arenicellales bacterium]